ncbi:P-loop containing nucleoside triphosphate hydrolase protein [Basidiobolus meristosporus CBS 931.73]|uniref:p-loop containing nucleoside triphosphate hydrolase protein n=1 Tax=Basidiobolus meristosporus CBS 931.73 TaxID=1314790 RepID=A0A1Y1Y3M8_9FUNG|nr:P-loop containing nucleoside triphosphate hydrolase protein [Basidiobolus meristosporus CBS 931.73]|eukprot:ORX92610.1 P-loop containing nucleoside triphosphate hydrolase protein [Basidiobolus meristosporus CBS 931.73]
MEAECSGIWVRNLSFKALRNLNLSLESGSRCVLLGANPEERETLLRILAGKHLVKHGSVKVFGKDAFGTNSNSVAYLNSEWLSNPLIQRDLLVDELIHYLGGDRYPDRRDLLLNLMNVSRHWHMHKISASERLRVQIVLRLLQPWQVLLIDEASLPLEQDTLQLLLEVIRWETEERGAIAIYSSTRVHGLVNWCTHFMRLEDGHVMEFHDRVSAINITSRQVSWQYKSPLMRLLDSELQHQAGDNEYKKRCRV